MPQKNKGKWAYRQEIGNASAVERTNSSEFKLKDFYGPKDFKENYDSKLASPGEYPYTRGIHKDMYRGKLWTMRMFSGFGTPEDTNGRLKLLLSQGETGLSVAFDMPTLYGLDANSERAHGEVGKCGVNVSSLKDMEVIFKGIPLDRVSTSMTINAPANILTAMYAVVGEKGRVKKRDLAGTVQADILKEYIAQKEWLYPPEAHMRIIRDMMVYCTNSMPKWNYISISGYHIREAGASAVQELAFTLADGFEYVKLGIENGLDVDSFTPRLSFFFNSSINFFEEIAKFRAARRIWAREMKETYGAKNDRSMKLRFHSQTSGYSLTWQQPLNNIVRTTVEGMAAIMGGTQSLHTNSYDEAWALPSEQAVEVALRTQQILAYETGIPDVIDPLGGSYYIENLTDKMEEEAYKYFHTINGMGGVVKAIKNGYLQREIAATAYAQQRKVESGEAKIVGVNAFANKNEEPINVLKIDLKAERIQRKRLEELKAKRNSNRVQKSLEKLKEVYSGDENSMESIIEAVKNYATLEEITNVGREVFGGWKEPTIL
ncbi:MAG: methylmalonyl-CoA mutase family protein [Candidatus Thermoplasmatota archaeon]|nr:methylmalonyl-CoA mutase family protein [Candidatus Thermoplasmatota archaeon]